MDISYWTRLVPKIKYEPTRKRYFGQYLCKLVLEINCGRIISTPESTDVEHAVQTQISLLKSYNFGGSWRIGRIDTLRHANIEDLRCLRSIRHAHKEQFKFRIEEPMVQIYSETEDQLRGIVKQFTPSLVGNIKSISFPESLEQSALLQQDKILVSPLQKSGYSHKVMLRDGQYDTSTKQQLLDYFNNLGDQVRLTEGTRRMLSAPNTFLWSGYFYTNDISLITFVSLINPKIVGKIHELVRTY